MLTLKAQKRDLKVKPESIRKSGSIPAVFYGKKQEATPISIKASDFKRVWEEAGESAVVTIETPDSSVESLIHDVDFDPVSGAPRHADFYVFEKGHKVEIEIPLEFVGVSAAVKDLGGILVKVLHALKVEAEPQNLPHAIEIDISGLAEFNNQVLAKDINLPVGVTLKEHAEEVVALVSAPREEKEEEAAPIDLASIEVEKKGKDEVPAEGAEAQAPEAEKKA